MNGFCIEIAVGAQGVRSVRVEGRDWQQSAQAYALLSRLGALIQQLDAVAREAISLTGTDGEVM